MKPSSNNEVLSKEVFAHLLSIAVSEDDEIDPNKRCIVITLALGMLTDPEKISINLNFGRIDVRYGFIKISLNLNSHKASFLGSHIFLDENDDQERYLILPNLAETYADHTRNMKALGHLKSYLPLAAERTIQAAVLGIAWAILQRIVISNTFVVSASDPLDGGFWIKVEKLGVSLQIDKNQIVKATYPGMANFQSTY
ncbi:hypothetical protein [Collimonas arenae]|uniref:hypothetical protein n=1 Tax=Collimonas arenae TaxID=279058 RepID=UPI00056FCDDA|nr:hypothetical protein [Collimonas arenae]